MTSITERRQSMEGVADFEEGNLEIGTMVKCLVDIIPTHWLVEAKILARRVSLDSRTVEYSLSDTEFTTLRVERKSDASATSRIVRKIKRSDQVYFLNGFSYTTVKDLSKDHVLDVLTEVTTTDSHYEIIVDLNLSYYEIIDEVEKAIIRNALVKTKGHQSKAARLLNLKDTTINTKIKKWDIETNKGS